MNTYTLKLISNAKYNLYLNGSLVSDADLSTLFGSAGEAYFVFDFNGGTPSSTASFQIRNTGDTANIIANYGFGDGYIMEDYTYKGTWSGGTAFTTFVLSSKMISEPQLLFLMHEIKNAGDTQTGASAPTTATSGKLGNFYLDTTNDDLYYLSAITPQGTDPETYEYTWETVGGGGGGIPTTATFWGASYNSVNNKVSGDISMSQGNEIQLNGNANGPRITSDASYLRLYAGSSSAARINIPRASGSEVGIINARLNMYSQRITSVADPTAAQDAATKNYVDNLAISYASLNGASAPTTATEGQYIGQLYYDTTNEDMYYLKAITGTNPATYTWDTLGGGGGIQNALIIREWS